MRQYRQLRETSETEYIFTEDELNFLGYRLSWENRTEEALSLLKLNAEEYPDSPNVYDSLGDAHAKLGNTELAAEAYTRALGLDSSLSQTQQKLDELSENVVQEKR